MTNKTINIIAFVLAIIGTVNLGLASVAGIDIVGMILSGTLLTILNALIGIAGLYLIYYLVKH
tara:strand:+ start:12 stop:200 length:189 start_codon:yes stop_codon:yes gene_type:complete